MRKRLREIAAAAVTVGVFVSLSGSPRVGLPRESEPFRLSVLLQRTPDGWAIAHYQVSHLPDPA
ncbi:nuclear transport factor 2 family protein [Kitasatospora sp. NPDC001660]